MQTVLFHSTIFGPIHSRRLGVSLGVNLMPDDGKVCTFDCLYCEAGYNAQGAGTSGLSTREQVREMLETQLQKMQTESASLDVITFSGNGEPTLHPEFPGVIDDTLELRDRYYPQAKVSVLTNSTHAGLDTVAAALRRVDNNIVKLDSAVDATFRALNRPTSPETTPESVIRSLCQFAGQAIVQTLLTRGTHDSTAVDNTTDLEIKALCDAYRRIRPRSIMLYSIDRQTPEHSLVKIGRDELSAIAARITADTGIPVSVA